MRVGVSIPVEEGLPIERLVELAREAERYGYDTVVAGEVAGPDVFALLTAIAVATERVTIGTGVVPMRRAPVGLLAMGFQTLASLAPGRVIAGVGVSSPTVIERWHGRTFAPPLAYVREFLPALPAGARRREARSSTGEYVRSEGLPDDAAARPAHPGRASARCGRGWSGSPASSPTGRSSPGARPRRLPSGSSSSARVRAARAATPTSC